MDHLQRCLRILKALDLEGVEYTLIGGMAVVFHGLPRFTEDIDLLVKLDKRNIEKLKRALRAEFEDPSIEEITAEDLMQYAVVRYASPEGFSVDLIGRLGEVADYETLEAEWLEVQGVRVRIATAKALYKIKHDSVRPKDQSDAAFLIAKMEFQKTKK